MHTVFSSYLLGYDGSGTPALIEHMQPLHPGEPFILDTPHKHIFLTGGFTTLYSDSPLPISPTLQVNGDLGNYSQDQLSTIARAELDRCTEIRFRSFTKAANPRVVVLGAAAKDLARFLETYGGVLDIEPLLTKGTHPEYTTANDLNINSTANETLLLDFLVQMPVDRSRCTYCGQCGPICPEQCIDAQLFIDFDRCSFCKECVQVCPHHAIDLHGAEKHTIETPALLLLKGTEVEQEGSDSLIYHQQDLPRLFASIFDSQIDETVTCNSSICQYNGEFDSGCELCYRICNHKAIHKSRSGIRIDQEHCCECGDCISICPTGALQSLRFTDRNFISYWKNIPLEGNNSVVIGCEEQLQKFWWLNKDRQFDRTFFLEHPAPAALNSMHLFFLLSLGAGQVLLLTENPSAQQPRHVAQVNTVCAELFSGRTPVRQIETKKLAPLLVEQQEENHFLSSLYNDFTFTNRREKLTSLLVFFQKQAGTPHRFTGELFSEFGSVNCDTRRCTQCLACLNQCHMGALTADAEHFMLMHTSAFCVQCGSCASLCPEEALTLQPGLFLETDLGKESVLAQAEPAHCLQCGKIFGTRQSLARVMTVLVEKNIWNSDDDLLKYCDKCRVIRLHESQTDKILKS